METATETRQCGHCDDDIVQGQPQARNQYGVAIHPGCADGAKPRRTTTVRGNTPHAPAAGGIDAVAAALDDIEAGAGDDDHVFDISGGGCTADDVADALDALRGGDL